MPELIIASLGTVVIAGVGIFLASKLWFTKSQEETEVETSETLVKIYEKWFAYIFHIPPFFFLSLAFFLVWYPSLNKIGIHISAFHCRWGIPATCWSVLFLVISLAWPKIKTWHFKKFSSNWVVPCVSCLFILFILSLATSSFLINDVHKVAEKVVGSGDHNNAASQGTLHPSGEFLVRIIFPVAGGLIAVVALLFNYRRTDAMMAQTKNSLKQTDAIMAQTKNSLKQLKNTDKTLQNAQRQLDFEQYKNAMDQLGSDSSTVILGGVHTLCDLAIRKQDYRERVCEVLCSFIRIETAKEKFREYLSSESDKKEDNISSLLPCFPFSNSSHDDEMYAKSIIIQTIIDKLYRSDNNILTSSSGEPFAIVTNLSKAFLRGFVFENAKFGKAKLSKADLSSVNLQGAILSEADLERTIFSKAKLIDADLSGVILQQTELPEADLEGVKAQKVQFKEVDVTKANFTKADLTDAVFLSGTLNEVCLEEAKLYRTKFLGAEMKNSILDKAKMDRTSFKDGNLDQASLIETEMWRSSFMGTSMSHVDLKRAKIDGTSFNGLALDQAIFVEAKIREADFENASMYQVNLSGAEIQKTTFKNASMIQAILIRAKIQRTSFDKAFMIRARLDGADIQGTSFDEAFMDYVSLDEAEIKSSYFEYTVLDQASFVRTKIQNVELKGAKLRDVNLTEAKITDCGFAKADLRFACLLRTKFKEVPPEKRNFGDSNMRGVQSSNEYCKNENGIAYEAIMQAIDNEEGINTDLSGVILFDENDQKFEQKIDMNEWFKQGGAYIKDLSYKETNMLAKEFGY